MKINLELIERFHEKWVLNEETGCWEWTGALMGKGYGEIKIPGTRRQIGAHCLSYLIHVGRIPDGMQVCHACDIMHCVRPSHLFAGTQKDNLQDMKAKDRHLYGTRNAMAKLSADKVRTLHWLASEGVSQNDIAKAYGVTQGTIWKILHGQRYADIYREIHGGCGNSEPQ